MWGATLFGLWLKSGLVQVWTYQAALQDPGPLQSHRDAVEKNEGQDDVVEEFMGDDGLTEEAKPAANDRHNIYHYH